MRVKLKKKHIVIFIILGTVLSGVFAARFARKPFFADKEIHYHAGFVVFENNKKLDFSDNKFMFIKPCELDGEVREENEDPQIEKAHLHDNVGDIVHVEEKNALWKDLFTNINFQLDYPNVKAYINGELVSDFEQAPIRSYESLVLFIGDNDRNLLSQGVSREYIEIQEKKGSTCAD